jgi:type II secretory pathway pseudopilin PulG
MPRKTGGFLLIEAMIAAVILSVAAAAIATLLVSATAAAESGRQVATAASLANQLLEEIAAKPLYYPTGTTPPSTPPTVRSQFAIVGQYAGYGDTTSGIVTAEGTTVSPGDGEEYLRSVTVTYGSGPAAAAPAGEFATVTVTVTTPKGRTVSVSRLIGHVNLST